MQKLITKNDAGIFDILSLLDKLNDHNSVYYQNMLDYFVWKHPPFPNSLLYWEPEENAFFFMSKSKLLTVPVFNWEQYNSNIAPSIIKVENFGYLNVAPFSIFVSTADWLYDGAKNSSPQWIIDYMIKYITLERNTWKSKLSLLNSNIKTNPLF